MEISVSKLANIILASMLLTALFFVAVTSSSGEYDPWLDYNDDGWINAKDAIALGGAFSSSGDPAKNVTMKLANEYGAIHIEDLFDPDYVEFETAGYRQITLTIAVSDDSWVETVWFVDGTGGNYAFYTQEFIDFSSGGSQKTYRIYQVEGAKLTIYINPIAVGIEVYVGYYMTA